MAVEYRLSYTASQIDEKLSKIDSLATKNEMPTKTSDLINDNGFTTESYVQEYAQPIGNYALHSEVALKSDLETKQNTLTGQEGQIVKFDASGNAVAADLDLDLYSITIEYIDAICGAAIEFADVDGVTF